MSGKEEEEVAEKEAGEEAEVGEETKRKLLTKTETDSALNTQYSLFYNYKDRKKFLSVFDFLKSGWRH